MSAAAAARTSDAGHVAVATAAGGAVVDWLLNVAAGRDAALATLLCNTEGAAAAAVLVRPHVLPTLFVSCAPTASSGGGNTAPTKTR